jgi:hypothetical protein
LPWTLYPTLRFTHTRLPPYFENTKLFLLRTPVVTKIFSEQFAVWNQQALPSYLSRPCCNQEQYALQAVARYDPPNVPITHAKQFRIGWFTTIGTALGKNLGFAGDERARRL